MNSNGQIMSLDLIASVVVFLLVFLFLYQSYFLNLDRFKQQHLGQDARERANQTADLLVNSSGAPSDWNWQTVTVLGLARERGVLDWQKIQAMKAIADSNYNRVRDLLNLAGFEFRLDLDSNNNAWDTNFGQDTNGYSDIFVAERLVTLEGEIAWLQLSLFR